jgi:thiamine-monophosphate kinase
MIGAVPSGAFVPRHGAKAGDHVFVSGTIGDAALGLALRRNPSLFEGTAINRQFLLDRYLRPQPRFALAATLRSHARTALDISDGLLKDLSRLAGDVGIRLKFDAIPLSASARAALSADVRVADAILGGGGDYEILAAVPPSEAQAFAASAKSAGIDVHDIGVLEGPELIVLNPNGTEMRPREFGYDHFSA